MILAESRDATKNSNDARHEQNCQGFLHKLVPGLASLLCFIGAPTIHYCLATTIDTTCLGFKKKSWCITHLLHLKLRQAGA